MTYRCRRQALTKQGANLGKVATTRPEPIEWDSEETAPESIRLFERHPAEEPIAFEYYRAQFGLQQIVYSYLSRTLGLTTLAQLQTIPAILTALVLAGLFFTYLQLYNRLFAVLFLLSLACAPYFLSMARNLYWNPYLMLAPALAAAFLYQARTRTGQGLLLGLIGLLMMLKCLSSYEYLTSVTLLACSVLLVAPMFGDPEARPRWKLAAAVFAVCVVGFVAAFLIHASVRGDTLLAGIRNIYVEDIARRTFGDPNSFAGETGESLRASVWDVLKIYFFEYPGRRTMIVPGKVFLGLFALSIAGIGYKFLTRHPLARRDAYTFVVFLLVPLSWFILAKGHSFTQTHINFVLWYVGFMPALLFVAWSAVASGLAAIMNRRNQAF
ncbi:glucosyltransferase domain-containing protein [Dokdonella immobilis]|uniref:Dolichyl-phosphate-mannose-protein mannosyltransferase n=1 Tax=Dokdonella immobilis TaxID=578942 RepID=A0A1I4Y201_9GAMM|nr:hypothetical protein [Dokdonella immobilis]SFN31693.1 hypothetical protein SAMN05216289_1142 [Dokdonella immobilis]